MTFQYGVGGQGSCAVRETAVASVSMEGAVTLWEGAVTLWSRRGPLSSTLVVALLDDFVAVIDGMRDVIKLLDVKNGSDVAQFHHEKVCTLGTMLIENGEVLCTGDFTGTVQVWLPGVAPIRLSCDGDGQVNVLLGVASGRLFVGRSDGGYLWDVATASCLRSFLTGPDGEWFSAAEVLSSHFCAAGRKGMLSIWDPAGNISDENTKVHRGQWVLALRSVSGGCFCSAAQDKIYVWRWQPSESLQHQTTLWGHTAVITRLAFLEDSTLVSSARSLGYRKTFPVFFWGGAIHFLGQRCYRHRLFPYSTQQPRNGEIIWWDLPSKSEGAFLQCREEPQGLTVVKGQAMWSLYNGLCLETADATVDWEGVVPCIPTSTAGSLALQRFAGTLFEQHSQSAAAREEDHKEFLLAVARQMRLPLPIETVFLMGSASRGTFVAAPHMSHEPADMDVGIRLGPGNVDPSAFFEAFWSETQSFLIPTLARKYIAIDQCLKRHALKLVAVSHPCQCDRCHLPIEDETYHCSLCDYDACKACMEPPDLESLARLDLWDCQRTRFAFKVTWHISRLLSRSIDLVPFWRVGDGDFPQLVLFDGQTGGWVPNNPPLFSYKFNTRVEQEPVLLWVAKLVKYWNYIQSVDDDGKPPLKGMHIESLLLDAPFPSNDLARALAFGFKYCAEHVLDSDVQPPGGSAHVGPSYIERGRWLHVQRLLQTAASLAQFSLDCDACEKRELAVGAWSFLFCESRWQDDEHAHFLRNPFMEWSMDALELLEK